MIVKTKNRKGCAGCELCEKEIDCRLFNKNVNIKFTKSEKWDCWGKIVTAFKKGTTVKGIAVIKDGIIYCASAESEMFEGITDFVGLDNVIITEEEK